MGGVAFSGAQSSQGIAFNKGKIKHNLWSNFHVVNEEVSLRMAHSAFVSPAHLVFTYHTVPICVSTTQAFPSSYISSAHQQ